MAKTPVFPSTLDTGRDDYDDTAAARGCGCFRRFWFGRDEDESHSHLLREKQPQQEAWLVAKLRKLKEFSELVAGPESYALNFAAADDQDDAELLHSFSTRFAPGFFINDHQRKGGPLRDDR